MEYNKILENIKDLDDYEKSDLINDLFKEIGTFEQLDVLESIYSGGGLDKTSKYETLYYLLGNLKEDLKKEYTEATKQDNGFHNVKAYGIEKEYTTIDEIEGLFYDKIY